MSDTALKYIKICTSNTCKGKVSGHVYESLRRETFSFCQGRMTDWHVQQPREGDWRCVGAWMIHFHVDPVKHLLGQLTAFFFFFLNSKTHWADSCKLWTKTVSAQAKESWHMFKLQAWTFCNGAMRFYCTYKVPQESTATNSRKKQARKKWKQFHSKQSKK